MTTSTGKIARVYEMQQLNYPSPTRQVYVDGILKSNSVGQAAAHESSVHPPMITHDAPKRVAIFGAGLGASTREVLKHKGVEEVTVIGADRIMVDFSKEYLPEWSDCSYANKDGKKMSCFDDSRVNFVYDKTPSDWIASYSGAPYDVALVDLL
jgi:spermidine synthase